ncbi:MAG: VWA domain-containing protein [Anaerolineae bacterium]
MTRRFIILGFLLTFLALGAVSCKSVADKVNDVTGSGKTVTVSIVYGSEKQEWLEPLIQQYNGEKHKTSDGSTIVVQGTPLGSVEAAEAIVAGTLQPTVWSPASSIYIPVANAEWRKTKTTNLVEGTPKDIVLSPVVIAMWRPMAEALGWPQKPLGWADIAALATSGQGWAAYGYPEWGDFKFGHTHPGYSNSGVSAIIAEAYAGAGKQRGLTVDDLNNPALKDFMSKIQGAIIHYGSSTGFFADKMFGGGPSYLSAAVLYENLVVAQESKRLAGKSPQPPVVAIYPKEGTFWANHPYIILNAQWVTPEQRAAAEDFQKFLLDRPQQLSALEYGFRPADPSVGLAAPLDQAHGVDPSQPNTVLEVPRAEVIQQTMNTWKQTKRPVDLTIVVDTSGSMRGDKINAVRNSLGQFINLLDDRDRLRVVLFNSRATEMSPLSPIAPKRSDLVRRVSGIVEGGETRLYDTVLDAYKGLTEKGDPKSIRAVVVLTDGQDNQSATKLPALASAIQIPPEQGGNAIKVFTIAYGSDADRDVLTQIADATGARMYEGKPENIQQVYNDIATFF